MASDNGDEERKAKERARWHRRMEDPAFRESERERHRRQVKKPPVRGSGG